jgi:oxygen-independent coproporphyrinogen-3 oxidase
VLEACQARFRLDPAAEITVEANPGDLDAARVAAYLEAGVNRLSLGVQSFDDRLLRLLGRRHSAGEAEQAFRQARAGGAANVSLDLMYGLPGQSPAHWRATLQRALRLEPDHLSAYLLTIDERVPLGRQVARGQTLLPPDDDLAEMYASAQQVLPTAGLEQYEISNWARPGRASRHNLTYWRDEPYLALGAGAAGCYGGRRYKHRPDPAAYIASVAAGRPDLIEEETTDPTTAAQDHLALRLRLREGLDRKCFRQRFGYDPLPALEPVVGDLLAAEVLEAWDGRLRIAEQHLLVSNEIILRLHEALARWSASTGGPRPDGS